MRIERDRYVQALAARMHNGMVKVVTGARRVGKSYLLFTLFRDYLLAQGVEDSNIVSVALDDEGFEELRDPKALSAYLKAAVQAVSGQCYVFLDELQFAISEEERRGKRPPRVYGVLNGLLRRDGVDVYVTGSNSRFLSSDILTEFRGRGDRVHVLPLTFAEFMLARDDDVYHAWADYVEYGGLPLVAAMRTPQQKAAYLSSLFEETYLCDIIERNGLRRTQELDDLVNVLASAAGSLTSPSKIQATFRSELGSQVSANTLKAYIGYLEDAFLVSEASRYDVKGRKYIGAVRKYYFEDVGLRNARLGFRQVEENHLMENVVYNELRARGFSVDVGVVTKREKGTDGREHESQLEVDFVANLGSARFYIQSAYAIPDDEKRRQEKASLLRVGDSFEKIVLVKDVVNASRDQDGIVTMGLFDFLLDQGSLRM
ncbi:MAG: ATP-binding protein [Coriobacteriia bacterium]|nr:ATP-binding protein [Coriobacteriia bacterium]